MRLIGKRVIVREDHADRHHPCMVFKKGQTGTIVDVNTSEKEFVQPLLILWDHEHPMFHWGFCPGAALKGEWIWRHWWHAEKDIEHLSFLNHKPVKV